jgi:Fic-DOC domain mobile mystery protein B
VETPVDPLEEPDDGATPLTAGERDGLIPGHVTLRSELNELEQAGVLAAAVWVFSRRRRNLLDERFIERLHRRMFGEVWRWAGTYRTTERNIGIEPAQIRLAMRQLIADARYWVEHHSYPRDEIAVRFHHRLVSMHPFPNGNGRISRMMADLIVMSLGGERFTWGPATLLTGETRTRYIAALRAADGHDPAPLIAFARS